MATLALTVVGGAIGGPVGAMLGAVIGQQADAAIFAPRGREGPRLTDLSVQTSSYGSHVPRLFGTMRVAGTVIWATELKERRSTSGGGKGRASTTQYSYSASFAVLLSARAVRRVLRIWADGKLLRGAAGDWKVPTGFRLHIGDPDQPVDPLIASAEGIGATPAHRGHAYAVFEDLALEEFGNRIPSLTFEVEADVGSVSAGEIVGVVAPGVVAEPGGTGFGGFAAVGERRRSIVELLSEVQGGWIEAGETLRWRAGAGDAIELSADDMASGGVGRGTQRAIGTADRSPTSLVLRHHDPVRDYQIGSQRVRRPGSGAQEAMIDAPMAMSADVARGLALAAIERRDAERETRRIALDWRWMGVVPGIVVRLADGAVVWRVREVTVEAMTVRLDLVRVGFGAVALSAASGRARLAPDLNAGETRVELIELPPVDGVADAPQLFVAACGTGAGWRAAALSTSIDAGASWQAAGRTSGVAIMGVLTAAPAAAPATLIDRANAIEVELHMPVAVLHDADDRAIDAGANLAMVGDELIQFGRAEPIGGNRWRLSRLWRGRRGTEFAAGAQQIGDRFVLIEAEAMLPIGSLGIAPGRDVHVLANGIGDLGGGVERVRHVTGWSVRPPAPVHGVIEHGGDGARSLRWVRRSRNGWGWHDLVDVPIGEERERYRCDWGGGSAEVAVPAFALPPGIESATVRQQGTVAASLPLVIGQSV
jgi:hypothetical protein